MQFHVLFIGDVQGVGFRFTMKQLAQSYGLTGWVKILPDGRVEALVQAEQAEWDSLCEDLKSRFKINDVVVQWKPMEKQLKGFDICY